jgi:hypothetical protein
MIDTNYKVRTQNFCFDTMLNHYLFQKLKHLIYIRWTFSMLLLAFGLLKHLQKVFTRGDSTYVFFFHWYREISRIWSTPVCYLPISTTLWPCSIPSCKYSSSMLRLTWTFEYFLCFPLPAVVCFWFLAWKNFSSLFLFYIMLNHVLLDSTRMLGSFTFPLGSYTIQQCLAFSEKPFSKFIAFCNQSITVLPTLVSLLIDMSMDHPKHCLQ